jgi:diguanylate cyclase (GGDEF)-like protein
MNNKITLLKQVGLFSTLKKRELSVLADYSEYHHFDPGDLIFEEGHRSREICVIKKGEVLISKHRGDEGEMELARFIQGECFGELDLLDNTPHTASAVADAKTILLIFPMKGVLFEDVVHNHPEMFARILHKLLAMIAGRIRSANTLISEKTQWIQDLRRKLYKDKLTGLHNRAFLEEDFEDLLPEYGDMTSMLLMKPDNFKEINDTCGHDAGDRVLKVIASTVKSVMREKDVAIRYRGDEFALVLPDTCCETAISIAHSLSHSIKGLNLSSFLNDHSLCISITVSIGVATYPQHAPDSRALTRIACNKMFEAREQGGDLILYMDKN